MWVPGGCGGGREHQRHAKQNEYSRVKMETNKEHGRVQEAAKEPERKCGGEVDVSEETGRNGVAEGGDGGDDDEKRVRGSTQPKKERLQPPFALCSLTLPTVWRNQGATEPRYL